MVPRAIVASFSNEDRTLAFQLQANGVLVQIERPSPSAMWSPPREVAKLRSAIGAFEDFLLGLTQVGSSPTATPQEDTMRYIVGAISVAVNVLDVVRDGLVVLGVKLAGYGSGKSW